MKVGLRIDVDTYRGTKLGVPSLCAVLREFGIRGSFFFSVGPDNMGRHVWRLLRPTFLWKMLRTKAASLYGWQVLLCGTFWPGPVIGDKLGAHIRGAAEAGHEIGLHAWDHHAWQAHTERFSADEIHEILRLGVESITRITGKPPTCSATPGWRGTDQTLLEKEKFPFRYNSDCRGEGIFLPQVEGRTLSQPQIAASIPTYDEVIGRDGISDETYNDYVLDKIEKDGLDVLTIHAEAEGIACAALFRDFLERARSRGIELVPLGDLLPDDPTSLDAAPFVYEPIPGREGWVACRG